MSDRSRRTVLRTTGLALAGGLAGCLGGGGGDDGGGGGGDTGPETETETEPETETETETETDTQRETETETESSGVPADAVDARVRESHGGEPFSVDGGYGVFDRGANALEYTLPVTNTTDETQAVHAVEVAPETDGTLYVEFSGTRYLSPVEVGPGESVTLEPTVTPLFPPRALSGGEAPELTRMSTTIRSAPAGATREVDGGTGLVIQNTVDELTFSNFSSSFSETEGTVTLTVENAGGEDVDFFDFELFTGAFDTDGNGVPAAVGTFESDVPANSTQEVEFGLRVRPGGSVDITSVDSYVVELACPDFGFAPYC